MIASTIRRKSPMTCLANTAAKSRWPRLTSPASLPRLSHPAHRPGFCLKLRHHEDPRLLLRLLERRPQSAQARGVHAGPTLVLQAPQNGLDVKNRVVDGLVETLVAPVGLAHKAGDLKPRALAAAVEAAAGDDHRLPTVVHAGHVPAPQPVARVEVEDEPAARQQRRADRPEAALQGLQVRQVVE